MRPREMQGVGIDYLTVRNWALQYGAFFSDGDVNSAAKVCVVGKTVVTKLFQTMNPLGQTIRVNNINRAPLAGVAPAAGAAPIADPQPEASSYPPAVDVGAVQPLERASVSGITVMSS